MRAYENSFINDFTYRIMIEAEESGVFNLEGLTSNSIIKLDDKALKFQTIEEGQKLCYQYDIKKENENEDIIVDSRLIKGEIKLTLSYQNSKIKPLEINSGKKFVLTKQDRQKLGSKSGLLDICAKTNDQAFFTIQMYLKSNIQDIKEYKELLLSKKNNYFRLDKE